MMSSVKPDIYRTTAAGNLARTDSTTCRAIHPRHHHVRNNHIDMAIVLAREIDRLRSVLGLENSVAILRKKVFDHMTHNIFIFHHENCFPSQSETGSREAPKGQISLLPPEAYKS